MLRTAIALILAFALTGCAFDKRMDHKRNVSPPKWADQSADAL